MDSRRNAAARRLRRHVLLPQAAYSICRNLHILALGRFARLRRRDAFQQSFGRHNRVDMPDAPRLYFEQRSIHAPDGTRNDGTRRERPLQDCRRNIHGRQEYAVDRRQPSALRADGRPGSPRAYAFEPARTDRDRRNRARRRRSSAYTESAPAGCHQRLRSRP